MTDDVGFKEHDDIRFKDYDVLWRRDINVHPCKIRATINQNKYLTFFIGGLLLCFCSRRWGAVMFPFIVILAVAVAALVATVDCYSW